MTAVGYLAPRLTAPSRPCSTVVPGPKPGSGRPASGPDAEKHTFAGVCDRPPDLSGRAAFHHAAGDDDPHPVGEDLGFLQVVGSQDGGLAAPRKNLTTSQASRRASGSRPVVGSSRKSRSGSPTMPIAMSSRLRWPPDRRHGPLLAGRGPARPGLMTSSTGRGAG